MARDYRKEYDQYHAKPEQRANRSSRNKARTTMAKLGRVKLGDGKEVDHKNGNPKDNKRSNLSVMSRSRNRAKH